ncbi:MAG: hypothetical protein WC861_06115 [Candidatus Micrarchaeia archaeon]|jgi:hypothetical protein
MVEMAFQGVAVRNMAQQRAVGADKAAAAGRMSQFFRKCLDPDNARLYGSFDQRAALNITQFPKIQGSLLIRMGMVYPIISYLLEKAGVPKDASTEFFGIGVVINYHTWLAGYLAYLFEIQMGLSKYPIEWAAKGIRKIRAHFSAGDAAPQ